MAALLRGLNGGHEVTAERFEGDDFGQRTVGYVCGLATFADGLSYVARLPLGVSDLVFVLGEYEYVDFVEHTNTHIIDIFGLEGLENLEEIGGSQKFLRCRS